MWISSLNIVLLLCSNSRARWQRAQAVEMHTAHHTWWGHWVAVPLGEGARILRVFVVLFSKWKCKFFNRVHGSGQQTQQWNCIVIIQYFAVITAYLPLSRETCFPPTVSPFRAVSTRLQASDTSFFAIWTWWVMRAKSLQSCLTLCNPVDCNPPGSSVQGILQARILEWVGISFSRVSSWPRDPTHISYVSCIGKWVLYHWCHLGSPIWIWDLCLFYKGLGVS